MCAHSFSENVETLQFPFARAMWELVKVANDRYKSYTPSDAKCRAVFEKLKPIFERVSNDVCKKLERKTGTVESSLRLDLKNIFR